MVTSKSLLASVILAHLVATPLCAAPDKWVVHSEKEYGFSAQFPTPPSVVESEGKKPNSEPHTALTLEVKDKQPGIIYDLSVTKIPGMSSVAALGEAGRDLIAQMMKTTATLAVLPIKGKPLSKTMTTVFGNPGIDFCAKGTHDNLPALVYCRVFLFRDNLILMQVIRYGHQSVSLEDSMRFLGSFRDLNQEAKDGK
jgi:hypothetical protein